ncbi:NAD-dependent epimerase/dehydratase family protein [Paludisphaera mucosa]|uniref:NAD(P)-dependent oxidoreductase n=1 Tax=Paludisphaera mucosa TaxID=3030827 RepID=A0ABT6F7C8_9BACT|nr:NAD(P)-dependent oxidoreductase [Paludisphaera mucosa]MDG3003481.1 NAD(P)-dependent oxidoreductase [Paludisphaera mucosa]
MRIAVTGATGFVGRSIVSQLIGAGHRLVCWRRPASDVGGFPKSPPAGSLTWIQGGLGDDLAARDLVDGVDAVVHAALDRPGTGFRGAEGDVLEFVERNVMGTLRLIERAREARVSRFVFISSCAVHDLILPDRPLDETHPTWSSNQYGAHKAAIEAFVASYGLGGKLPICALRPCGVYGLARRPQESRWFELIREVAAGRPVECRRGGKEVHADDVARGVEILLTADGEAVSGKMFNCCDRYISEYEVAQIARRISGTDGLIAGEETRPKNQIATDRIQGLGMTFGGTELLERTISQLVAAAQSI